MKPILFILATFFWGQIASAISITETQSREIHVLDDQEGGIRIIMQLPLTLAYANELARRVPGATFTAPFMKTEMVRGNTYYRLDGDAVLDHYELFGDFLLRDFRFSTNGTPLTIDWPEYVVIDSPAGTEPVMPGLIASQSMLSLCTSEFPDQPYISDTLIVFSFYLTEAAPTDPLRIELLSRPLPAPEDKYFETRIVDYRDGSERLLTFQGASFAPVTLTGSPFSSFTHSVKQRLQHIQTGYDRVLFALRQVSPFSARD